MRIAIQEHHFPGETYGQREIDLEGFEIDEITKTLSLGLNQLATGCHFEFEGSIYRIHRVIQDTDQARAFSVSATETSASSKGRST